MRKLTIVALLLVGAVAFAADQYYWIPSAGGIAGQFDVKGSVIPVESAGCNLGSTSKYFSKVYADSFFGPFSIGSTIDTSKFRRNGQTTNDTTCNFGFHNAYGDSVKATYFGGRSPFWFGDTGIFALTSYRAVKTPDSMFATTKQVQLVAVNVATAAAGIDSLQAGLDSVQAEVDSVKSGLDSTQAEVDSVKAGLDSTQAEVDSVRNELGSAGIAFWRTSFRAGQFTLAPDSAPAMIQNDSTNFSWYTLAFDQTAAEKAYILDATGGYAATDTIDSVGVQISWTANSATTDTVRWTIDFIQRKNGQLFDSTLGNGGYFIDVNQGAGVLNVEEAHFSVAISDPDDILSFCIGRDPTVNGNLAADAQLVMVRLTYYKANSLPQQ
jgi:hypothetical protein